METKMKMLDLFSGYGGFTLAADQHNIETVAFCEIDKYASQVLKHNWKGIPNHGDITKTDFKQYRGEVDIITGGSPCQSFSIAGKRTGMSGQSGIIDHYFRSIEETQPTYFIWENVKGVLSIDRGWTFANILNQMVTLGYDIWWTKLNATDFGIPQNRERIFVTGIRAGSGGEILFEPESGRQADVLQAESINTITTRYGTGESTGCYVVEGQQFSQKIEQINDVKHSNDRIYSIDGISPAFTLTAQDRHGIFDGKTIRKLTPLECERLMGLPDNHTRYGVDDKGEEVELSDSQRYKMCGNGVVPQKVAWIMSMLKKVQ